MTDEEHGLHKEPRPSEHRKLLHGRAGREWQGLGAASDFVLHVGDGTPARPRADRQAWCHAGGDNRRGSGT